MMQLEMNVTGQGLLYQLPLGALSTQTHFVTGVLSPIRVGAAAEEMAFPSSMQAVLRCLPGHLETSFSPSFLFHRYLPFSLVRFADSMKHRNHCFWSSSPCCQWLEV